MSHRLVPTLRDAVFVLLCIDCIIGLFLFKSRFFSHLAIWHIIESDKKADFSWHPDSAPAYVRFEKNDASLSAFREEIRGLIAQDNDELGRVTAIAHYVMAIKSQGSVQGKALRWDSPKGMLAQVRGGARPHCFHRAILFSTFLTSVHIPSRLWALENKAFDDTAHTVVEAYLPGLRKWVCVDTSYGLYVSDGDLPLSFLELREKLLQGKADTLVCHSVSPGRAKPTRMPSSYGRLARLVFLRAHNDFAHTYAFRYGVLSMLSGYLDKLPDSLRLGMSYFLGNRDIFMHYIDNASRSLRNKALAIKAAFYFFMYSLGFSVCVAVALVVRAAGGAGGRTAPKKTPSPDT